MHPLEPTADEMRAMGAAVVEFVANFVAERDDAPAVDLDGATELATRLRQPPPDGVEPGNDLGRLLDVVGRAAAKAVDTTGPGYLAYIPGGGLYTAALADFVACGINRFVNLAGIAPALTQLEANVVRWLCDLFAYPPAAQGVLLSGGSMANFSAIVAARTAHLGDDLRAGVVYVSPHGHQSVAKAARLAGLPADAVQVVATDGRLRMDVDELAKAIAGDRAAGRQPFLVVANAGTTDTGTVDPLADLADVARAEHIWLHADAAYGGFFQLTQRGQTALTGIERADSITLDPHKGMFLPYGTGALIVRDGDALRRAHTVGGHYLRDLAADDEIPSFAEYSPELSRDFRGLRVWLPLHLHGVDAFRTALDEKLDLARFAYDELKPERALEFPVGKPDLSVVAFRHRDGDDATRALLSAINGSGRVFASSTVVDGRVTIRFCVLSHRTHRQRVAEAVEIVRSALRG